MKEIETITAVGHILCHDITQIVCGKTKDARFRKGHIVTEEDIPVLLSLGKDHLYVWETGPGILHEDEAAKILSDWLNNIGISFSEPKEGKIEAFAQFDGLLKVDRERLHKVNFAGEMMIACRSGNTPVKARDKLAGTRIIPLVIQEEKLSRVRKKIGTKPLIELLPYRIRKVGVINTGNEVFHHRIKDTFTPVIVEKIREYGGEMMLHEIVDDSACRITEAILAMKEKGMELILCTGGMSVDPDDRTPAAIRNTGADVVSYGAPVLPGAMFLLSYLANVPVLGLPGCVMYAGKTVFDLVLPRIMAQDHISSDELSRLGDGGLCLNCPQCHYPCCSFGKGW